MRGRTRRCSGRGVSHVRTGGAGAIAIDELTELRTDLRQVTLDRLELVLDLVDARLERAGRLLSGGVRGVR